MQCRRSSLPNHVLGCADGLPSGAFSRRPPWHAAKRRGWPLGAPHVANELRDPADDGGAAGAVADPPSQTSCSAARIAGAPRRVARGIPRAPRNTGDGVRGAQYVANEPRPRPAPVLVLRRRRTVALAPPSRLCPGPPSRASVAAQDPSPHPAKVAGSLADLAACGRVGG